MPLTSYRQAHMRAHHVKSQILSSGACISVTSSVHIISITRCMYCTPACHTTHSAPLTQSLALQKLSSALVLLIHLLLYISFAAAAFPELSPLSASNSSIVCPIHQHWDLTTKLLLVQQSKSQTCTTPWHIPRITPADYMTPRICHFFYIRGVLSHHTPVMRRSVLTCPVLGLVFAVFSGAAHRPTWLIAYGNDASLCLPLYKRGTKWIGRSRKLFP